MARLCITGAVLLAAFAVGPAGAQDAGGPPSAQIACTTGGLPYSVGEYACLPVCHGARRLARCESVMSAFSGPVGQWTYVSDACPSAMIINPPWPNDWTQVPPATAMTPRPVVVNLSGIAPEIAPRIGSHWQ